MTVSVIIPTYNAQRYIKALLESLQSQIVIPNEIILIDSSSNDKTVEIASKFDNVQIIPIDHEDFNHATTRTFAAKIASSEFLIFLTQDVLPCDNNLIGNLLSPFSDLRIAAAGGRQIAHTSNSPFSKHHRIFNYPNFSFSRTIEDKYQFGFKSVFLSNSVAAYRKSYLEEIDWFESNHSFGEDSIACAKLLLKGYKIYYCSEAVVYHAHDYSIVEEFKRYVNIGVFHNTQRWILEEFGKPESEGLKFVISEFKYLIKNKHFGLVFQQPFRVMAKYIGYKIGKLLGPNNKFVKKIQMYK